MDERKVQGMKDREYQLGKGVYAKRSHEELLEARQQRLAGSNFCRRPRSSTFSQFNFTDACNHAHYTLYNRAYFVGLIL